MKYEHKAFILALFVILSYVAVGIAIGFQQYLLAAGLFLLGFVIMGFGLRMKRKQGL
ncbi:hypothetical protein GCM10008986_21570 [Salinibacillus aidingensis]|uniref:Uncharacterized protein n=1 Tax=Salinibacillus aidingensis TaxID=237684 RepID=A0ABN1BC94_9BACI